MQDHSKRQRMYRYETLDAPARITYAAIVNKRRRRSSSRNGSSPILSSLKHSFLLSYIVIIVVFCMNDMLLGIVLEHLKTFQSNRSSS